MTAFSGMDAQVVNVVAGQLESRSEDLGTITSTIDGLVQHLLQIWDGPDLHDFSGWWFQQHRPALESVRASVHELSVTAARNVAEQTAASGETGAGFGAGTHGSAGTGGMSWSDLIEDLGKGAGWLGHGVDLADLLKDARFLKYAGLTLGIAGTVIGTGFDLKDLYDSARKDPMSDETFAALFGLTLDGASIAAMFIPVPGVNLAVSVGIDALHEALDTNPKLEADLAQFTQLGQMWDVGGHAIDQLSHGDFNPLHLADSVLDDRIHAADDMIDQAKHLASKAEGTTSWLKDQL